MKRQSLRSARSRSVLYCTLGSTPHDSRIASAVIADGWSLIHLKFGGVSPGLDLSPAELAFVESPDWIGSRQDVSDSWTEQATQELSAIIERYDPSVVHAGPLPNVAFNVLTRCAPRARVAMTWGYDILLHAKLDLRARERAVAAIDVADLLFADNEATVSCARSLGASPKACSVFPWGIDLTAFPFGGAHSTKALRVISARNHEEIHDVALVIRALAQVFASDIPQSPEIVFAGGGSMTDDLRNAATTAGLDSATRWTGPVSEAQLGSELRRADVYIAATRVDGTSVTLLQAMASGVVAIVPDSSSNRHWIRDGETGITYRPGDVDDLAAKITWADANRSALAAMRSAAREEVEKNADWEVLRHRFVAGYEQAIRDCSLR
jgi:glycosyltransferase involved in cell wall biosynthesis